jgi:hypothetical protein
VIGYKGWRIPEGNVVQVAKDGVVLWKLETSKPIILEVEKITSDTYAGETAYTGEQFILLDIYPKTNGTVNVTYGGLTKTITDTSGAEEPNAQKVFFGTFNGVSDSVATPTSGTLTIEGDCVAFGCSYYVKNNKAQGSYSACIVEIVDWGDVKKIANSAFRDCTKLALASLPSNITSIGDYAFYNCSNVKLTSLPIELSSIGSYAFYHCQNISIQTFNEGLVSIGDSAFEMNYDANGDPITSMYGLTIVLPSTIKSIGRYAFMAGTRESQPVGYLGGVKLLAKTPPIIPEGTLAEIEPFPMNPDFTNTFKVTVPVGCANVYRSTTYWSNWDTRIVEG